MAKWPKQVEPLTPEQQKISDDFMRLWCQTIPKYRAIESFNHGWVVEHAPKTFHRTLEIGAGLGEHLRYEWLTHGQMRNYFAMETRAELGVGIKERFPGVEVLIHDCQVPTGIPDGYFDRILAIHVLEHLPNLPATIKEMHRLCSPTGTFQVVIPCEGGLSYWMCRRISAQRLFEKTYKQSYRWFIEREHINRPYEIFEELGRHFSLERICWFPFGFPWTWCNLAIAMNLRPLAAADHDRKKVIQ